MTHAKRYKNLMAMCGSYLREEPTEASNPDAVADLVRPLVSGAVQELLFIVLLDKRNNVIAIEQTGQGTIDRIVLDVRTVFRNAIVRNAAKLVIAHNHPSGDASPSTADLDATRKMVAAGKVLGIPVVDHVIIGARSPRQPRGFYSMHEHGAM